MVYDYSTQLKSLIDKGEALLDNFESKNNTLVTKLDYLSFLFEGEPDKKAPVDDLRYATVATFSPYKGKFRKIRVDNKHLLSCLFSSEPTSAPDAPAVVSRKDYNYLKPSILAGDCTRRELTKFSSECKMWLEKSLTPEDRADNRLVFASIRNVIDNEWDQILSEDS